MTSHIIFKDTECIIHCHCLDHDNTTVLQHQFDDLSALQSLLNIIRSRCVTAKNYTISIPDRVTMSCDLTIDADLTENQWIAYLQSQSHMLFGYQLSELYFDFAVKTDSNAVQPTQKTMFIVAAQRHLINHIRTAFDHAHLSLSAIRVNEAMNLLPWRHNHQRKIALRLYFLFAVFIVFISFLVFSIQIILRNEIKSNNTKVALLNKKIIRPLTTVSFRKKLLQLSRFSLAKKTADHHNSQIAIILSDLANSLPTDVTLTQLNLSPNKITFNGKSNQIESIHNFIVNLQYDFSTCSVLSKKIQSSAQYANPFDFEAEIICP